MNPTEEAAGGTDRGGAGAASGPAQSPLGDGRAEPGAPQVDAGYRPEALGGDRAQVAKRRPQDRKDRGEGGEGRQGPGALVRRADAGEAALLAPEADRGGRRAAGLRLHRHVRRFPGQSSG